MYKENRNLTGRSLFTLYSTAVSFSNLFRNPSTRTASWSFASISRSSDDSGLGSLRAKFDVSNGPSNPAPVSVQFLCLDATLSGIDFEMTSPGFRVSLVKKQVMAGKSIFIPMIIPFKLPLTFCIDFFQVDTRVKQTVQ